MSDTLTTKHRVPSQLAYLRDRDRDASSGLVSNTAVSRRQASAPRRRPGAYRYFQRLVHVVEVDVLLQLGAHPAIDNHVHE